MSIAWGPARGNSNPAEITAFETKYRITLPTEYKKVIASNNGATSDKSIVNLEKSRGIVVFESLLNWDKERPANIYFWMESLKLNKIIPFGKDPFGNVFCFDFRVNREPAVVFWDHETEELHPISKNWDSFISSLRKN